MRINYIILAHDNPLQLKRLIEQLTDNEVYFYIHIDEKIELNQFEKALEGINNIYLFKDDRLKVTWGSFSIVKVTILMIKKIIKDGASGYCILMSGRDYPIKTKGYIKSYLINNYGLNFISGLSLFSPKSWAKALNRIEKYNFYLDDNIRAVESLYSIYEKKFYKKESKSLRKIYRVLRSDYKYKWGVIRIFKKRKFPEYLNPYGGSQWWALPIETIKIIDDFIIKNKNYLNFHRYTHCPDEIFFHSIIYSNLKKEHITDSITYVDWTRENCKLPVTFKLDDFHELSKVKNKLFARKFDESVDSEILNIIDKALLS
jgi:hypothetical protein